MRNNNKLIYLLLFGLCGLPISSHAADVLNYFSITVPAVTPGKVTCVASDPLNVGTFGRLYSGTPRCSGLNTYHLAKGGGTYPWSSESYWFDSSLNYIRQMIEVNYDETTGEVEAPPPPHVGTGYRALRYQGDGKKGIFWMPRFVSPPTPMVPYKQWSPQPYVEEYWR